MRLTLCLLGPLAALTFTTAGWAQTAGVVLADDVETGTLKVTESPPGRDGQRALRWPRRGAMI